MIDASVAVKWLLPERHAAAARRLLRGRRELLAPDLIWAEVGNALWKRCRRAELAADTARKILQDFRHFPLQTHAAEALVGFAWDLANRYGVTVYDGLYLALAVGRNCPLVTADRPLYDALNGHALSPTLVWVEQVQ